MTDSATAYLLIPGSFLGIVLLVKLGRRLGERLVAAEPVRENGVPNTIEAAIYALFGLMVAFTFAGAASRFDAKRTQTVQEANAIGTAYLRLDLLPASAQPPLREKFRRYTAARIEVYRALPDLEASNSHAARAVALQGEIWSGAVTALKDAPPVSSQLLLPALNEMIDITTTRAIMLRTHTPAIIVAALLVLTLVCSVLIGAGLAQKRSVGVSVYTFGFALVVTVMMYVIFDLDHPSVGLIRLDHAEQALTDVLAGMR